MPSSVKMWERQRGITQLSEIMCPHSSGEFVPFYNQILSEGYLHVQIFSIDRTEKLVPTRLSQKPSTFEPRQGSHPADSASTHKKQNEAAVRMNRSYGCLLAILLLSP